MPRDPFTLSSYLDALRRDRADQWTIRFIYREDEEQAARLADGSGKQRIIDHLLLPLALLDRITGPERRCLWPEDPEIWESRVSGITRRLNRGFQPPPLLVARRRNGRYQVLDGNHRLEAMLRRGITEWPCILFSRTVRRPRNS